MAQNSFRIVCNRIEGDMAVTDDLHHAGTIVAALMKARHDPEWTDYWVIGSAGEEYYYDPDYDTVFSAACFAS